jgi:hypothetical protein
MPVISEARRRGAEVMPVISIDYPGSPLGLRPRASVKKPIASSASDAYPVVCRKNNEAASDAAPKTTSTTPATVAGFARRGERL